MNNMIGCYNIISHDEKILLVKEKTKTGFHWALPAGKLEVGETLFEGAIREAKEETGLDVRPVSLVGVYQIPSLHGNNVINFAFFSEIISEKSIQELIKDATFFKNSDITDRLELRDFIVFKIIQDYYAGCSYPLSYITELDI